MHRHRVIKIKAGLAAVGFLFITLIPMWGALHVWLNQERALIERAASNDAMNLAIAFEVHVQSVVRFVDVLIQDLREHVVQDQGGFQDVVKEELDRYRDMVAQVSVISKNGNLAYSSLNSVTGVIDLSGREHFRVHSENPLDDKLFTSKPVFGRVSGIWSIQFTRPLIVLGKFSGVIVVSVPTAFFSDFYSKINVGNNGLIALVGLDRVPRAVASKKYVDIRMDESLPDRDLPYFDISKPAEGLYRGVSFFDGSESLTAYRRQENSGLIAMVKLSPSDYLASYYKQENILYGSALVVSLFLLAFSCLIYFVALQHLRSTKELKHAYGLLQERVNIDSLTGALSRGCFLEKLDKEFGEFLIAGGKLSFILLDIDYFKKVNDIYGHPIGDLVLKQVVSLCCSGLRDSDSFGRLGGEEFGIILAQTDGDSATAVAEKLRMAIESFCILTSRGPIRVTVSLGVAFALSVGDSASKLISRADDALYCAKRAGRNRVSCTFCS